MHAVLAGAAYHHGDWMMIGGQECQVVEIVRLDEPQRFGLHWEVTAARCTDGAWLTVRVDDDGLNHNTGCPVGPSDRIED